jgi:acyl-coenzyme A thioesterase PaaI-like protein
MNKQPSAAMCFVCGVHNPVGLRLAFYETGPGEVTAHFTPPDHYQGYPGVLHGGIVAAALDEAGGRAAVVGEPNQFMVTATMEVKYRQPTPVGQPLTIVGCLVKRRGRVAITRAELRLPDGSVSAEAELMLADTPAGRFAATPEGLAALGWRVYPDAEGT